MASADMILGAYADGSELALMITSFNVTHRYITDILHRYKEDNREKKSFTKEFKKMVAQRDMNGITRNAIAKELGINPNTVKKFCEQFGQAMKEKATSNNEYTRIDGDFPITVCPSCDAKKPNIIDERTTYCKKCGNEHIHMEDHALKVNFEYLED